MNLLKVIIEKYQRHFRNGYVLVGIIVFLLFFVIISYTAKNALTGILFAAVGTFVVIFIAYVLDYFGKRKHKSIHNSALFKSLKSEGFKPEVFGEYIGLINTIGDRTVRIYYDWNKMLRGPLSFGDIVIDIHYEPLVYDYEELLIKTEVVKRLNNKYEKSELGMKRFFTWDRVVIHLNYYPWTKSTSVDQTLESCFKILESENLLPLDIDNLNKQLAVHRSEGGFMPYIDLAWDEIERQKTNANTT